MLFYQIFSPVWRTLILIIMNFRIVEVERFRKMGICIAWILCFPPGTERGKVAMRQTVTGVPYFKFLPPNYLSFLSKRIIFRILFIFLINVLKISNRSDHVFKCWSYFLAISELNRRSHFFWTEAQVHILLHKFEDSQHGSYWFTLPRRDADFID